MEVLDRNVRWREGELDLIAVDGRTLVFVEVKTLLAAAGSSPSFSPFDSIDARKQTQVRRLARRWLVDQLEADGRRHSRRWSTIRFDAVAVVLEPGGAVRSVEHLPDAF